MVTHLKRIMHFCYNESKQGQFLSAALEPLLNSMNESLPMVNSTAS
jgi:hypothetical protein